MKRCRLCKGILDQPELLFRNMPQAAQNMPDKEATPYEHGIDIEVIECSSCGLVQLGSEPVSYYRDVIRASGVSSTLKGYLLDRFSRFVADNLLKGKKVLEVGCGDGTYLELLGHSGMIAYGVENNSKLANSCLNKGLAVSCGFFDGGYNSSDAPFNAFFMFNYLEHLPHPRDTLSNIAANLKSDAVGIVEVPNLDMMIKKRLYSEFIADHLCYYNERTLRLTLELSGFDILNVDSLRDDYVLSATVKKRRKLAFAEGQEYLDRMLKNVQSYIDRKEDIAIWGAGHQAFTLLAMLKDIHKIKFIIDSAEFKQGKYSPVTHISIQPPSILDTGIIRTIIVVAGSYNDEIAKIAKERYPGLSVAILKEKGVEKA